MEHSKLRCSILAVGDFPEGGATSQRLYMLAKLLNDGVGDTSLWILHPTTKAPLPENNSSAGDRDGVKFTYLSGTTVRPSGIGGAFLDTLRGIYKSVQLIAGRPKERPEVLVIYTPTFLKFIVPMVVAKLLRIPMIVEVCEIFSKSTGKAGTGFLRRLANSGEPLMERLIPVLSAGLLVISQGIRRYYADRGVADEATYLLPILVDSEQYQEDGLAAVENLRGVQFLLNSGTFSEKDGLSYIVKAVASVHEEYPDIKLVFTGTATTSTQEKILEDAGLKGQDWIIFTGFLSRKQLIWCYKNARGLLCCRSNSDYANYGFPTKLAEYLSAGRPIIATTVGDVKEYLVDEQTAFLAESENVDSIALAIRRLLHDSVHAEKIGRQGAEVARKYFDYPNHVEKVSRFIRGRIGAGGKG
jgi:glycosyltransferase involved in cell wall biosynthesis